MRVDGLQAGGMLLIGSDPVAGPGVIGGEDPDDRRGASGGGGAN